MATTDAVMQSAPSVPQCYIENTWWCPYYWSDRRPELVDALIQHVELTVASVAVGFAFAFPLALLARRYGWLESTILAVTTMIYTIPSLALFSLFAPYTGLTARTVIIGLALYSLTILVRNILAGLQAVPGDVREAALGSGYGAGRMLFQIELPLAMPVIMAGLRVATVSTVALVTVGVIVGHGGLGQLITGGFNANFYRAEIVTGAVGCVLLALVADLLLAGTERALTPWARRSRS